MICHSLGCDLVVKDRVGTCWCKKVLTPPQTLSGRTSGVVAIHLSWRDFLGTYMKNAMATRAGPPWCFGFGLFCLSPRIIYILVKKKKMFQEYMWCFSWRLISSLAVRCHERHRMYPFRPPGCLTWMAACSLYLPNSTNQHKLFLKNKTY